MLTVTRKKAEWTSHVVPINLRGVLGDGQHFTIPISSDELYEALNQEPYPGAKFVIVSKKTYGMRGGAPAKYVTTVLDIKNGVLYRAEHTRGLLVQWRTLAKKWPKHVKLLGASEVFIPNPMPKI